MPREHLVQPVHLQLVWTQQVLAEGRSVLRWTRPPFVPQARSLGLAYGGESNRVLRFCVCLSGSLLIIVLHRCEPLPLWDHGEPSFVFLCSASGVDAVSIPSTTCTCLARISDWVSEDLMSRGLEDIAVIGISEHLLIRT